MKAIMMSIRPQWVAKILNGEKTIEIRKRFPIDYVGWVYIYCTKDKQITLRNERYALINDEKYHIDSPILNGKVVARFWCDKVDLYDYYQVDDELSALSCVPLKQLEDYVSNGIIHAIHITKLEIFDKPKAISEFRVFPKVKSIETDEDFYLFTYGKPLTRAPQSWQWIEI